MSAEMQAKFLFNPFLISNPFRRHHHRYILIDTIRLDQTMKPMAYKNKSVCIKAE